MESQRRIDDRQPGMRGAGFERAALYLIRPDGYVALVDPQADPERLRHYFAERGGLGQHGGQAAVTLS